jgi:hypothetical protein
MKSRTAVIVQGQTNCDNVKKLKQDWSGYQIIFSTWEGDPKYCYSEDDVVIYNQIPSNKGVGNLNLQKISSLNGFLKAKKMGFDRVIKWRSDMFVVNTDVFVRLFKTDFLNFLAFHDHHAGYLVDYFCEGDVESMISLFDVDINVSYPEESFTNKMFGLGFDSRVNFILRDLKKDVVDVFWKKRNIYLSELNKSSQYGIRVFKK